MKDILKREAANELNPKWENMISRKNPLYKRDHDIRSEFERDYTRIIHCRGYRRMNHKTQVFFSPQNDHICTRGEHIVLVESISNTIAKYIGLNTELTRAIATAHDIGHSPFGHQGEKIISAISKKDLGKPFWHERNGLEFVEKLELLDTPTGHLQNLNLTYAVRDGIISHCGEIDENMIKPREEYIDLENYKNTNQYTPYTWEGCVVKIADKISYLGRDISDAVVLGILDENHLDELYNIIETDRSKKINNTVIINDFIGDLCENTSLEKGLSFSNKMFEMMNKLKKFNYENIYRAEKLQASIDYFEIIINKIYWILKEARINRDKMTQIYPELVLDFEDWIKNYWNKTRKDINENEVIFDIENEQDYLQAIIYYISGMTDNYAISMYNKIINF